MKKIIILMLLLCLCGCSSVIYEKTEGEEEASSFNLSFKDSDLNSSYSVNGSTYISLSDEDIRITRAGTYILEGEMNDAGIIVDVSKDETVQLVLNNVSIQANDFAAIYIVEADEVIITLAQDSINTLSDKTSYTQIDDNNVDAIIYSKADLTLNGSGTLNIDTVNHGLVSKDDLVITEGTYSINASGQGIRGKDCLKISGGTFNISSVKDALKSDNSEDEYRGYVYITGGTFVISSQADGIYGYRMVDIEGGDFTIATSKSSSADSYKGIKSDLLITISGGTMNLDTADDGIHCDGDIYIASGDIEIVSKDDGIHADGMVQIDNGNISITAYEGIEGTYIQINDGTIYISASDDGINAGQKSNSYTATVEINGGYLTIVMGQGDTDGIDSNGYLYINGGTVNITGQSPFDYDKEAQYNGGTLIVNGSETTEITNQFAGGMGNMGGFGGGGGQPGSPGGNRR